MAANPRRKVSDRTRRFYERALSEAERDDLPAALDITGVDQEIALLRVRLKSLLTERPEDFDLMFRGLNALTRLLSKRYGLASEETDRLGQELEGLRDELKGLFAGGKDGNG